MKQHEHHCPGCGIDFLCRGKACDGIGSDFDKNDPKDKGDCYCEDCWNSMSD